MSTHDLDPCNTCPNAATVATSLAELNENVTGLRRFLQGEIGPNGAYRGGMKQEHDRMKEQLATLIEAAQSGKKTRWDLVMLGISIIGAAIAGHYTTK